MESNIFWQGTSFLFEASKGLPLGPVKKDGDRIGGWGVGVGCSVLCFCPGHWGERRSKLLSFLPSLTAATPLGSLLGVPTWAGSWASGLYGREGNCQGTCTTEGEELSNHLHVTPLWGHLIGQAGVWGGVVSVDGCMHGVIFFSPFLERVRRVMITVALMTIYWVPAVCQTQC